jgi:hypothetical protein
MAELHAASAGEPRHLSAVLILGVLVSPPIFAWLVLRRGYSRDVRIGAFLLLALTVAVQVARLWPFAGP